MPIRNIALCIIKRCENQILFQVIQEGNKSFLRLPGGGIEFRESALAAIQREIKEELHCTLKEVDQVGVIESFFEFNGQPLHEIAFVFRGALEEEFLFVKDEFEIVESNGLVTKAIWKSLQECKEEGWKIVPIDTPKYL